MIAYPTSFTPVFGEFDVVEVVVFVVEELVEADVDVCVTEVDSVDVLFKLLASMLVVVTVP